MLDISPLSPSEYWADLSAIIEYLTKEADCVTYEIPDEDDYDSRIDWQVKQLAGILKPYCVQICTLFRKEGHWVH